MNNKQRVIKFRAWNKELKQFDYNPVFSGNDNNSGLKTVYINKIFNCNEKPYKNDNVVIEQYTGIKDKDKNEIYEGDIIKGILYCEQNHITREIVFDCGSFCIKHLWQNREFCFDAFDLSDCKIIGNIHENKELLK
jgi:uncharacterized phage protein (TIGR01671 family)